MPAKTSRATALRLEETPGAKDHADGIAASILSTDAFDDRIAIVGTAGSGKTYAAKGFVERLLAAGARVTVVDPLGVWWGLRASADGATPGYPVIVFGGRHGDVAITAEMGAALGRLIAGQALACVVDLSELGSSAARRRFMAAFAEALYETNEEPLHLVLDEADLWAPQRPIKGWDGLWAHLGKRARRRQPLAAARRARTVEGPDRGKSHLLQDLTAIVAALAAAETGATDKGPDGATQGTLSRDEAVSRARLEQYAFFECGLRQPPP